MVFCFLGIFSLALLNACDDDLLDITESFSYEHEFIITGSDNNFSQSVLINLSEEENLIYQYGDKIKKIEIEKVEYWVKNFVGSNTQQLNTGSIKVANKTGSEEKTLFVLQNANVAARVNSPAVITPNEDGRNLLAKLAAKSPHEFQLSAAGSVNETPLNFTLVVKVTMRMTANPLK